MTLTEVLEWVIIGETSVGLLSAVVFLTWYIFRLVHEETLPNEYGSFMLSVAFVAGSLFAWVLAGRAFGQWPGRLIVAVIVYTALVVIVFWMPRLIYISYRDDHTNSEQELTDDDG